MIEIQGKEYVMRGLKTKDIYTMSRILKKMQLKMDAKTSPDQVGVDLMMRVLENLHLAENEVNAFLSGLIGMEPEKFADLDFEDTFKVLSEFQKQKGLSGFFTTAAKLT